MNEGTPHNYPIKVTVNNNDIYKCVKITYVYASEQIILHMIGYEIYIPTYDALEILIEPNK